MSKVVNFPTGDFKPDELLEKAKGRLKSVFIMGVTHNKEVYISTSTNDLAEDVYRLEYFKYLAMSRQLPGMEE